MREWEFSRRGNNFHLRRHGNWGVVNFQKSTRQIPGALMFTVNLGVSSSLLSAFYGDPEAARAPNVLDCHWNERIGFLLPDKEDKWWLIGEGIDTESTAQDLVDDLRDLAIPTVLQYTNDLKLRDHWLDRFHGTDATMKELMNLSVLLKSLGPTEPLEGVLQDLKTIAEVEPTIGPSIDLHLRALEDWG